MMAPLRCDVCGATGGLDGHARFRNLGRRNQGAMGPLFGPTEWSPRIGLNVCPRHFRALFYRLAAAERGGYDVIAFRDQLVEELRK